MPGLLVNKQQIPVQGLATINPNDADWCRLDPKDCAQRSTSWVRQIILHTTKGGWPQDVRAGRGGGSKTMRVAEMWRGDLSPSGAHIVIDNDGTVACLCDLATTIACHATVSNAWSIGIEMYQESVRECHPRGGLRRDGQARTGAVSDPRHPVPDPKAAVLRRTAASHDRRRR